MKQYLLLVSLVLSFSFSALSQTGNSFKTYTKKQSGTTKTNLSGGIQGGISNGMDIYFKIAFKPVATLIQKQDVLTNAGEIIELQGKGRHDPCVVPRAVPIVEAMAALVITDYFLLQKINR